MAGQATPSDSTATESKIIAAATAVFLQKGKDGARMQEIADRAGINKAMLHYYFRSKDKLYEEVFSAQLERFFFSIVDAVPKANNVQEFLANFVDNYMRYLVENEGLVRFIIWEIQSGGVLMSRKIRQLFSQRGHVRPLFLDLIENAVSRGEIRRIDPVQFIISLIGVCAYPFIARPILEQVFPGLQVNSEEFIQKRKQEVVRLLWEGVRSGQAK